MDDTISEGGSFTANKRQIGVMYYKLCISMPVVEMLLITCWNGDKKSQPGKGHMLIWRFPSEGGCRPCNWASKNAPAYENTEYAEISQFLQGPVTTNEDTKDKANEDGWNDLRDKESSPHKDYTDVEDEAITFEI
ncbi:hypothetical protein OS493_038879 [Desmophyllum pertusum]|uniref:Uncharacterized protein n=1 Tax=Desmophyllum pertusum TaxID=174260 RepID=A0A9X0CPI1_9CNID|nr:hypothetical protein OS493_038879 [Desmophyllum pertusum]